MITSKKINEGQLTIEVGKGLNISSWRDDHPDEEMAGKSIISYADGSADDQHLLDVVEAHEADDDWEDPTPIPPTLPTDIEKLQTKVQHLQDQLDDGLTDTLMLWDVVINNGLEF